MGRNEPPIWPKRPNSKIGPKRPRPKRPGRNDSGPKRPRVRNGLGPKRPATGCYAIRNVSLRLTALHIHAKNVFIVRIYFHESPPARYLPTVHIIAMMCTVHRIRKIMA